MPLPKEKSTPVTSLRDQTILLYGFPKTGKTTFASQFPNALFFAFEDGHKGISAYVERLKTWKQFQSDVEDLLAISDPSKYPYKVVVVDTVNGAYDMCAEHVGQNQGFRHASDLAMGKGWALIRDEFLRQINKITLSPFGTVLIAHTDLQKINTGEREISQITPDIPGKLKQNLTGMANCLLYVCVDESFGGKRQHVIKTKPTELYQAGCHVASALPETIPLNFKQFNEEWNKAVNSKEAKNVVAG
jgi:hypothetical protein